MAVRLITYDLSKEITSDDYAEILDYIKSHAWARLSESSYAIETTETPEAIYQELSKHLDTNDSLLVLTLTSPWDGRANKAVIDWLKQRLW